MEYTSVPNIFFDHVGTALTANEQLLWIHLYARVKTQRCQNGPSHEGLARLTNLSVSSVKRTLKSLKEKGLIDYVPGRSSRNRSQYTIFDLPEGEEQ